MSNERFPILGTEIPTMLGRSRIMHRIWNDLTKTTPSNLTIVGPRFVGKTVIMHALAQRFTCDETSPYEFVLDWHLGHVPPTSDEDFITQLSELLRNRLALSQVDTSEYREYLEDHSFSNLKEVTDSLDEKGFPILMLWDGFDKPLGQGKLTGHLWDQMRTIFYGKKHKIITATRKPLRELIRSQDAISSPFWNIFDMNPVRISAFDEEDTEAIIKELSEYSFQTGAKTELVNWSAGFPPIFLELLNQIISDTQNGQINNDTVNQAAKKALDNLFNILTEMWQDCSASAKDLYIYLVDHGDLLFDETGKDERECLIEKGFARKSGNKLETSCRMIREYIRSASQDTGSMARFFGSWDKYTTNIRSLLENRLAHISRFDERLYRLVERTIEDIPKFPDDCLNNLTGIEERALDLIWQREFGESRVIPKEIVDYWYKVDPDRKIVKSIKEQEGNPIPGDRGFQLGILQLLTGSSMKFDAKARCTSKDTYVLINPLHSFRNRDQHPDGQSIHIGTAVAAIMCCLELLACLDRESPA